MASAKAKPGHVRRQTTVNTTATHRTDRIRFNYVAAYCSSANALCVMCVRVCRCVCLCVCVYMMLPPPPALAQSPGHAARAAPNHARPHRSALSVCELARARAFRYSNEYRFWGPRVRVRMCALDTHTHTYSFRNYHFYVFGGSDRRQLGAECQRT